jgi:WS/DGAT/MGAT family acyltransferase
MSGIDAVWLHLEESTHRMNIAAVLWFDEPVEWERLRVVLRQRLVEAFPRLRQRVVPSWLPLAPPTWEDDPAFDLDAHLQRTPLPAPGGQAALEQLVGELMSTPLDTSRPPWRLQLVEGFGQGSALLACLHHSLGDGVALARLLLSLADAPPGAIDPTPASGPSAGHPGRPPRGIGRVARLLASLPGLGLLALRGLLAFGKLLGMRADPRTPLRRPLTAAKRVAWSAPIALEEVKALGRAVQGTLNDVLLAAVTGALRRYLLERGSPARTLRALIPVNLRPLDEPRPMGNRFGLIFLPLPVEARDPRTRLRGLGRHMGRIKRSPEAAVTHGLLRLLGWLPAWLERRLVRHFGSRATLVMTNVPGPRQPVRLAGARVGGVMFWVPQTGHLGLSVSIFSYAGRLTLGVASDAGVLPEPRRLIEAFQEELAALAQGG